MSSYSENAFINDPNHVWSKIFKLVPEGSVVLDVGCSSGNLGKVLIDKKDCQVDGIELDKSDAKAAAKVLRHVWSFSIEDQQSLKQIDEKYDVIIFADVLEHLLDPVGALKSVKSLTKSSGKVIFSVPNMAHISIRLALLSGDFRYTEVGLLDHTHLHFYDIKELKRIISEAGLSIESLDYSLYPYPQRVIKDKLKKLDLRPVNDKTKLFEDYTASAFQFIGAANYRGHPEKVYIPASIQQAENDLFVISKALEDMERQSSETIKDLKRQLNYYKKLLQDLLGSKTFRIAQKVVSPYRQVAKKALRNKQKSSRNNS